MLTFDREGRNIYIDNEECTCSRMYVVNCNDWVSLRESPYTSASRLTTIPYGAKVEFLSVAANGFYEVYYNGHIGYVLSQYLSYESPYGFYY